jgi:hypothetical protein
MKSATVITTDVLEKFCSTDPNRASISVPWTSDGYTWATDGRVLIRVPAITGVSDNPKAPQNPSKLWSLNGVPELLAWLPLPAAPEEDWVACDVCHDGTHLCDCGHDHECGTCDGLGKVLRITPVTMDGGYRLNDRYVRLLSCLPDIEVAPFAINKAIPFRFSGGDGLLMPLRTDEV